MTVAPSILFTNTISLDYSELSMDEQSDNDPQKDADLPEPRSEVSVQQPPQNHTVKEKKSRNKKKTILAIVLIVFLLGGASYLLFQHFNKTSNSTKTISQTSKKPVPLVSISSQFFDAPQQMRDLNFFSPSADFATSCTSTQTASCPSGFQSSDVSYYEIGLTAAKQPIIVATFQSDAQGSSTYVAVENTSNHYEIIGDLSGLGGTSSIDKTYTADFVQGLNTNVTLDSVDTIPNLNFPQTISVGSSRYTTDSVQYGPNGYFINGLDNIRYASGAQAVAASSIKKIGSSGVYTYYEVTEADQSSYQVKEIYATLKGVYAAAYTPVDAINSDPTPATIQWTDSSGSTTNTNIYYSGSTGCSSPTGYVITNNIDPQSLIEVGIGPNQQPIYELPTSSPLFSLYYNDNYSSGTNLSDSSLINLTASQFQADHAVIVAQNGLGEYVVYERTDMFMGGGCGKPVIYLYPTKPTDVNVSVGATITKSDPHYQQDGWVDVMAYPGGSLFYRGQSYKSLFWEGKGLGIYPLIDSGVIVAKAQAVSTIQRQLSQQGLNPSEIADFLAYWQPKLPSTAFVRLTWLDTAQMNQLAPLRITPAPETLIRVFLDFAGVNSPYPITPQTFSAPARNGFTVVEWGGLLRNH